MKRSIIIIFFLMLTIPCTAQWKNTNFGWAGPVLAFGVHDTSFFLSDGQGSPAQLVYRYNPANHGWIGADKGIDSTQGNVTSFASLGTYLFVGMTESGGGNGPGYLSTDNGTIWKEAGGAPVGTNGSYLFGSRNSLYGSHVAYIARSIDSGKIWDSITNISVNNFAANGVCILGGVSGGVWRSTDTGNTWTHITFPAGVSPSILAFSGTKLFSGGTGVSLSTDSGTSWSEVGLQNHSVRTLAISGTALIAGTSNGLFVSLDTGKSWLEKDDSITYLDVYHDNLMDSEDVIQIGVFDTLVFAEVYYKRAPYTSSYFLFERPISEFTKPDSPASVVQIQSPDSLSIYPNPAMGTVTILAGGTSIEQIEMLNVLGKEVLSVPASHESEISLDISKLPSGTYFMQIQTANGIILRKIVKEE